MRWFSPVNFEKVYSSVLVPSSDVHPLSVRYHFGVCFLQGTQVSPSFYNWLSRPNLNIAQNRQVMKFQSISSRSKQNIDKYYSLAFSVSDISFI